ncbi:hypothetical protein Pf1_01330 [Flavobacterium columnare]|nr:hypothetical protein Pf1_00038 [Flavobacterium columnare]ANO49575.1 hypothetical protein Pf1_01330 [Flavobacterium columnare]
MRSFGIAFFLFFLSNKQPYKKTNMSFLAKLELDGNTYNILQLRL